MPSGDEAAVQVHGENASALRLREEMSFLAELGEALFSEAALEDVGGIAWAQVQGHERAESKEGGVHGREDEARRGPDEVDAAGSPQEVAVLPRGRVFLEVGE